MRQSLGGEPGFRLGSSATAEEEVKKKGGRGHSGPAQKTLKKQPSNDADEKRAGRQRTQGERKRKPCGAQKKKKGARGMPKKKLRNSAEVGVGEKVVGKKTKAKWTGGQREGLSGIGPFTS